MRTHRLVVGVDGSAAAARALHWAVRRAARDGASVLVVTAWTPPHGASTAELVARRLALTGMQRRQIAAALVAAGRPPPVARQIILADPVTALCHAGRSADLVVLGCTGLRGSDSLTARIARRLAVRRPELPRALVAVPKTATAAPERAA